MKETRHGEASDAPLLCQVPYSSSSQDILSLLGHSMPLFQLCVYKTLVDLIHKKQDRTQAFKKQHGRRMRPIRIHMVYGRMRTMASTT